MKDPSEGGHSGPVQPLNAQPPGLPPGTKTLDSSNPRFRYERHRKRQPDGSRPYVLELVPYPVSFNPDLVEPIIVNIVDIPRRQAVQDW